MKESSDQTIAVLHVDDDPDFADLTASLLERESDRFTVETATSADEGLAVLADRPFDCVVSDYDMPGRNGIDFLEAVREEYPRLPFVLYTGKGSEEVASEAISAGLTDYLQKGSGTDQYTVLANRITNAVDHHRSQRALAERKQALKSYERMVNSMNEAACIYDENGRFELVNEYLAEWYGTTRDELEGRESNLVTRIRDGADGDPFRALLEGEREEVSGEIATEFSDHGYAVIEYRLTPLEVGGSVEGVVGVARDVTERTEREQRLETLNRATRELLSAETREEVTEIGIEVAKDVLGLESTAIHLYDDDCEALVPTAVTQSAHDLVGDPPAFEPGESIAWRAYERGEVLAVDDVRDHPDRYNPDTVVHSELHVPIADEGILIAGSTSPAAFDEEDVLLGEILAGNVATALEQVERTDRLRTRETELTRQNDRLEQFASIVSHDLRNPLNVANARLELLAEGCESDHLAHVERAHDRMEGLIDDLLTLARYGEAVTDREQVVLSMLVEGCWANVETADATVVLDVNQTIEADRGRLKQLFENLFRNAVEHGGDTVTVTVGELPDGFYVEDDGPGFTDADHGDVFEPGYSTSSSGTGFGLTIVEQVAEAHDWTIDATNGSDGGARFEITGVTFADT